MKCKYGDYTCRYGVCHEGYLEKESDGATTMQKCSIYSNIQNKKLLEFNLSVAGIHGYIIGINFSDYKGADESGNVDTLISYCETFSVSSKHAYMFGTNGTQKSTLARIVGKELLSKGYSVRYIITDDLVKLLTRADREEDARNEVEKLINVDLLILDEFERSKMVYYESGWQLKFIFPFLKKRMELIRKPVLIISNSPIDSIGKNFDNSTQDLISREIKTVLTFSDVYMNEVNKIDMNTMRG